MSESTQQPNLAAMTPDERHAYYMALMDAEWNALAADPRLTPGERECIFYGLYTLEEVLASKS